MGQAAPHIAPSEHVLAFPPAGEIAGGPMGGRGLASRAGAHDGGGGCGRQSETSLRRSVAETAATGVNGRARPGWQRRRRSGKVSGRAWPDGQATFTRSCRRLGGAAALLAAPWLRYLPSASLCSARQSSSLPPARHSKRPCRSGNPQARHLTSAPLRPNPTVLVPPPATMPALRHLSAAAVRSYTSRAHMPRNSSSRLQLLIAHSAITAGVVLPFVHPYLQTRKAKRDGTYMTKPPIPFTPSPKF